MSHPASLPLEHAVITAPFGRLGLSAEPGVITGICFLPANTPLQAPRAGSLCAQLADELARYWQHPEHVFSLPLRADGTPFQQRVWQALRDIPSGHTVSYRELAARIGAPRAVRAVASACAANPLAVVIPCHRVVRSNGELAGYAWGIERKRALLAQEAAASAPGEDDTPA